MRGLMLVSALGLLFGSLGCTSKPQEAETVNQQAGAAGRVVPLSSGGRKLTSMTPSNFVEKMLCLAVTSDGQRVVTGSDGNTAVLWEASTAKPLQEFKGHTGAVYCLALSADGNRLLTGAWDGSATLWDTATGKPLQTFVIGKNVFVTSVALSANGKYAITGVTAAAVVWDVTTGKSLHVLKGPAPSPTSAAFTDVAISADGDWAITRTGDQSPIVWNALTGKKLKTLGGKTERSGDVAISADGKRAYLGSTDNSVAAWNVDTGQKMQTFTGHASAVKCFNLSPDGSRFLTGGLDSKAILWNEATGELLQTFVGEQKFVDAVAISSDGERIWSVYSGALHMWNVASGRELCLLMRFEGGSDWLAATPDGFVDGTPGGLKRMEYLESGTWKTIREESTTAKFHRVGLWSLEYRGQNP